MGETLQDDDQPGQQHVPLLGGDGSHTVYQPTCQRTAPAPPSTAETVWDVDHAAGHDDGQRAMQAAVSICCAST